MIEIRKAKVQDVDSIVSIHNQAFPDFFLTTLGSRFLQLYYKCMCNCKNAITLCAEENGEVKGFATSSFYSHGFNTTLIKKNLFKFGLMGVELMFTKPKAILRLAKNLDKKAEGNAVEDNGEYAELYSIAVMPGNQGSGIGKKLLIATEETVAKHNSKISLTTDYYNNEKTIGFYHSLGYQDYYEFVTYPNRRMWRMIKQLQ